MGITDKNVINVLEASIPQRCQDIGPFEFEDLIAIPFNKLNYKVKQTPYSGDYGADIIITNENNINTVVQVKRYSENNKVGVKDLNQLLSKGSLGNGKLNN